MRDEPMPENKDPVSNPSSLVEKVRILLEKAECVEYRPGSVCRVIRLGSSELDEDYSYYLAYYEDDGSITVTLKKHKNQSNSFAVFKITDKILELETKESFLERMGKIYDILAGLASRIGVKKEFEGDLI